MPTAVPLMPVTRLVPQPINAPIKPRAMNFSWRLMGFLKWMSGVIAVYFVGLDWLTTCLILGAIYLYLHYMFATCAAHIVALYVPLVSIAISAGAPALFTCLVIGILSNLMWGLTEYGSGPGPLYFGQGYFERPRFYGLSFVLVTFCLIVAFSSGLAWWKFIGLY